MLALLILVVMVGIGVLARLLSTVGDPTKISSWDDRDLPPSLERSPRTGWLHPLGTDDYGRDVYSLWLYAARNAVADVLVLMFATVLVGALIGVVASKTLRMDDWLAGLLDFLLTIPSRAFVAIPSFVLAMAFLLLYMEGTRWANASLAFLVLGIYGWAWAFLARRVREHARSVATAEAEGRVSTRRALPGILTPALLVAKFAVVASMIWQAGLSFCGLDPLKVTWGGMLEHVLVYEGIVGGEWNLVLPPNLGILLVTASAFVVLDRLEAVVGGIQAEQGVAAMAIVTQKVEPALQ